jgi:alcohol dehydrogenase class IV
MTGGFTWRDGERLIVFGRGSAGAALDTLGGDYTLLTTTRARDVLPELTAAARAVHEVGPGRVDELAAGLREEVDGERLVALGGGRVIDTAKALAAADPPRRVAAIPTTLSGAEMTSVHRHAGGVPMEAPRVRPDVVINDPALCASQPEPGLAASAANALGHAAEGPLTSLRSPVTTLAALEAARRLSSAFAGDLEAPRTRDQLALSALLAGYVIGSTWYGLHHVVSQTVARLTPVGHGVANAIVLPQSLVALRRRFPAELAELDEALGTAAEAYAAMLRDRTGVSRLREAGVGTEQLDRCAEAAAGRPELAMTPPPPDRDELRDLLAAAW